MIISEWRPVTQDLGLIQLPLVRAAEDFLRWHSEIGTGYKKLQVAESLALAFQGLLPLSAGKRRCFFAATTSEWTAFFQSGIRGSDPFPAMSMLAQRCEVLAMRVCVTAPDDIHPAVIWEVYAPKALGGVHKIGGDSLGYRRSICVANDAGRWVFEQSGLPFPFESTHAYAARRKRDRFTAHLLSQYLQAFGLAPLSDEFYVVSERSPAILLERPPWPQEPPDFTLDEVRAGLPWAR